MAIKIGRRIAQFVLFAVAIYLISYFTPGLHVTDIWSAMTLALFASVLIFLMWPVVLRFSERLTITTFGLGSLFLSAFIIWLGSLVIPGITISGWGWIVDPVAIGLASSIITLALEVDDDEIYLRSVHQYFNRCKKKSEVEEKEKKPSYVFLEIDGLPEAVLKEAIEKGKMPFLGGLVKAGRYKILGWETDLSSQTGASQAGILHGYNKDIPAFRWVDKSIKNKIVSSSGIGDASMIEHRISNGQGLLSINGGAVANLFTGDSKDNIFVYSALTNVRQLYSESWRSFYIRPFNFSRVLILSFLELFYEIRSWIRQWRRNIQPRLANRGLKYLFARGVANVILREIATYILIGHIIAGEKDTVYSTFFGYDEIAHHCGIRDDESFFALEKLDQRISRIFAAQKYSERPSKICILSDHGQTNGATFKQRYGLSLGDLVKNLVPEKGNVFGVLNSNQDHFMQMVDVPAGSVHSKIMRNPKEKRRKNAETIVLASGNLGLVYFTKWPNRMTMEEINAAYPRVIPGLVNHQGIGFIMVSSSELGTLVLGSKGKYFLSNDKIEGENPLAMFEEHSAMHLKRTDSFKYLPDILVMSLYDSEKNEVAAFEELIGSHGGIGGEQSKPFIMHPSEWNTENRVIVGAEQVYKLFKEEIQKSR